VEVIRTEKAVPSEAEIACDVVEFAIVAPASCIVVDRGRVEELGDQLDKAVLEGLQGNSAMR
jgi:hypothetical protein